MIRLKICQLWSSSTSGSFSSHLLSFIRQAEGEATAVMSWEDVALWWSLGRTVKFEDTNWSKKRKSDRSKGDAKRCVDEGGRGWGASMSLTTKFQRKFQLNRKEEAAEKKTSKWVYFWRFQSSLNRVIMLVQLSAGDEGWSCRNQFFSQNSKIRKWSWKMCRSPKEGS